MQDLLHKLSLGYGINQNEKIIIEQNIKKWTLVEGTPPPPSQSQLLDVSMNKPFKTLIEEE